MASVGTFNLRLFTAFSAVVAIAATAGAETKPQFTVNTNYANVTVAVDEALRKHPGLYDNLLTEGRRWAGRVRGQAEEEYKTYPDTFVDRRWFYERTYAERSVVGPFVSVLREDGQVIGTSPQPSTLTKSVIWDREKKRRVAPSIFFRETAGKGKTMTALAKIVRNAVASEKIRLKNYKGNIPEDKLTPERVADGDRQIQNGIQPMLNKLGAITLVPSTEPEKSAGLTFHYAANVVAPLTEGPYTVFVHWSTMKGLLSPRGEEIFGGERPEEDDIMR